MYCSSTDWKAEQFLMYKRNEHKKSGTRTLRKILQQTKHVENHLIHVSDWDSNLDTSHKRLSETDSATPKITTCPCANDLNSMKEHIKVSKAEITAMWSFVFEQMVFFKKSAPPISDTYPEQNSQYIDLILEQIDHLRQENQKKNLYCSSTDWKAEQFLMYKRNEHKKSGTRTLRKILQQTKHAEDHLIHVSDWDINSALPHAEDHLIHISDRDIISALPDK